MKKRLITFDQAVSLLNDGEIIHTFRNGPGMLLGVDYNRNGILSLMKKHESTLEIGGEKCRKFEHGVVLNDGTGNLFIETNEAKLNAFDPLPEK